MEQAKPIPDPRPNLMYWWPMSRAPKEKLIDLWVVPMLKNATMGHGIRHPDCGWDNKRQAWFHADLYGHKDYFEITPAKDGTMWKAVFWTMRPDPPTMV